MLGKTISEEPASPVPQPSLAGSQLQNDRQGQLRLARTLFRRLNESGIRYCHWKSNEHLDAGLAGRTDLDVLVDRRQERELQTILASADFKRFAAPPLRGYPAIADYIGFDEPTGQIAHLHLHYELTLGERFLKGYRLAWEDSLLATRQLDPETEVYVADPAVELLLLFVRAALKQRLRDRFRAFLVPRSGDGTSDFERELLWLRDRTSDERVLSAASRLIGPGIEACLGPLLAEATSPGRLAVFGSVLRDRLRVNRTYGAMSAAMRTWLRELHWYADAINRRYLHRPVPLRRISPRGGAVIVLLGSDGSGKSTLSRTLQRWLGWKLDVMPIYFGSGDGEAAFYRQPLRWALLLWQRVQGRRRKSATPPQDNNAPPVSPQNRGPDLRAAARVPWALALSLEKRSKLRRMTRARNQGMIVVCDRFPQSDITGFNDGPLLAHWQAHSWRLCRALAAWEARPYLDANRASPDLVIKLIAAPSVVQLRRPDMSAEGLARRVQAVRAITFPPTTRVIEVDAASSLESIALRAKREVWAEL